MPQGTPGKNPPLSEAETQDYERITEQMKDAAATFSADEVRQYVTCLAKLYTCDPDTILKYTYLPTGRCSSSLMAKLQLHVSRRSVAESDIPIIA